MASLFASLPLLSHVRSESGRAHVRVPSTLLGPESLIFRREAPAFNMSFRQQILSMVKDKESKLFNCLPGDFGPRDDDDLPDICVTETKCTSTSLFWKANIRPEPEPEPDLFVLIRDTVFFIEFSPKEDGTMSPKYFVYLPPTLKNNYKFTGCSCNGLLYLSDFKSGHALWNPTTSEYKILPKTFVEVEPRLECLSQSFGMAFDPTSQDYKMLHFVQTGNASYHIHLYSLKTNSWKRIPLPSTNEFEFRSIYLDDSACVNGVYYCVASPKETPNDVILAFDFTTETLSTLPLPEIFFRGERVCLIEYKGLLCAYKRCDNFCPTTICDYELWIMRDDIGSWTRESIFHTRHNRGVMEPLRFSQDGKLVYFTIYLYDIMVFNRATRKLKSLGEYNGTGYLAMLPFVESFVQLNGITRRTCKVCME